MAGEVTIARESGVNPINAINGAKMPQRGRDTTVRIGDGYTATFRKNETNSTSGNIEVAVGYGLHGHYRYGAGTRRTAEQAFEEAKRVAMRNVRRR